MKAIVVQGSSLCSVVVSAEITTCVLTPEG